MKKTATSFVFTLAFFTAFSQTGKPDALLTPMGSPDWGHVTKSLGDSCGAYFNNYIGLQKTTNLYVEYMRTGDVVNDFYYNGRAQRFNVSQPVEVSGLEFYAYHESMTQDSVMVITTLHAYSPGNDSLGPEITRDTVYVTHTAFTVVLPNISVKSYFDAPVTMATDFVIAMHSNEDEELFIITNDWTIDEGNGEGNSYLNYFNPSSPGGEGWYSTLNYEGDDMDYLMSPLVKYDLHNSFTILNDTICPDVVSAGCVSYTQMPVFTDHMYNLQSSSPSTHLIWLWGDGFQNTDILTACHTYNNPGTFNINLHDTLFRYDFGSPYCVADITKPIVALDVPVPSFTFLQDGLSADFTNTSTNADSVWWDFGDATAGTDADNPSHTYTALGTYDVWLHAYNQCYEDSTLMQVTTDDVGIHANEAELNVYPNPANTTLYVSGLQGEARIELFNLLGEQVYVGSTNEAAESIPVNQFSTGTYFVRITDGSGQVTKKIAVKH